MSRLIGNLKRAIAGILTAALVVTAVPVNVYADVSADDPAIVTDADEEAMIEAGVSDEYEEEPEAEEVIYNVDPLGDTYDRKVLFDLKGCSVVGYKNLTVIDGTYYVKSSENCDISFKLGFLPHYKLVGEVTYQINDGEAIALSAYGGKENEYTIPYVTAGMTVKITAKAEETKQTVKFLMDSNTDPAVVKYQAYDVSTCDGEVIYIKDGDEKTVSDNDDGEAEITLHEDVVIGVTVTPADGNMTVYDSVKIGTNVVEPLAEAAGIIPAGTYLIEPVDGAEISVNTYKKVDVAVSEATGAFKENGDIETLTSTTVNAGRDGSNKATGGKIEFTQTYARNKTDYQVALKLPKAVYTEEGTEKELEITKVSGQDNKYEIAASEVAKAVKAGSVIAIKAQAEAHQMVTITMNTGGNVKNAIVCAYASDLSNEMLWTDTLDGGETMNVRIGDFVRVGFFGGNGLDTETDFIRVSADSTPVSYGTVKGDALDVGTISEDTTVKVESARLDKNKVRFDASPKDDRRYKVNGEITSDYLVGEYVKAINSKDSSDNVRVAFNVDPVEDVRNYRIKPAECFYVVGGERSNFAAATPQTDESDDYTYRPPFESLAKAAFDEEGITFYAGVEYAGYRRQEVILAGDYYNTQYSASVEGETLKSSREWAVPYNKDLEISLVPKLGYRIVDVRYAPAVIIDAMFEDAAYDWLFKPGNKYVTVINLNDDGEANFKISPVDEKYYVFVTTEETEDYVLIVDEDEVIGNETTIDAEYNESYSIKILKGATSQSIGASEDWTITATIADADVTEKVFGEIVDDATEINFSGSSDDIQGKTVTVTIESKDKSVSRTVRFEVNKKVTKADVSFNDASEIVQLGAKTGISFTAPDGFDYSRVAIEKDGKGSDCVNVELDGKNKKVWITTDPCYWKILKNSETVIRIVNANYRTDDDKITETALHIQAEAFKKADLKNNVSLTIGSDSITFDFSKMSGEFDSNTTGLYYKVQATRTAPDSGSDEFISTDPVLVPAQNSTYELRITDTDDAFSADPVTYTATASLVQSVSSAVSDIIGETPTENNFEKTGLKTTADGVFATKLTFTKNKNVKTVFNTMESCVLGTVNFPDVAKNVPVTVKRLRLVEIRDKKTGEVYADSTHNPDVIYADEYNRICFKPENYGYPGFLTGSYTMVAYAVEPKGVDVEVRYAFTVNQGITDIEISAPEKVYKASGKAATVKATACFWPDEKPLPQKKVVWSLEYNDDPNNITINKSGVVTIAKNVKVPAHFRIVVVAADYEGHKVSDWTDVTVTSIAATPGFVELGTTAIEDGGEYYTSELVGDLRAFDSEYNAIDATFSVSGLTAEKDQNKAVIGAYAAKPVKNASITVAAADGSKAKKVFKFKIISDEDLGFSLKDYMEDDIESPDSLNVFSAKNVYPAGKYLKLHVTGKHSGYINHAVKAVGLKQVKSIAEQNGTTYYFNPTARDASLTLYEGTAKKPLKTVTINVTNERIPASTVKTSTTVTASNIINTGFNTKKKEITKKDYKGAIFNKLFFDDETQYDLYGAPNRVKYTVKNGKVPYVGKVLISTDDSNLNAIFGDKLTWTFDKDEYYTTTDDNGQFVIDYQKDGKLDFEAGVHSFTVTPVDKDLNPVCKPVVVKVKAAAAPKAGVTVNTVSFSNFVKTADFGGFKKMDNIVIYQEEGVIKTTADFEGGQGGLKGINTAGKINRFSTVFSVDAGDGNLSGGKLRCVKAAEGYDPAYTSASAQKKVMIGWVKYSWINLDGSEGSQWVKITVKGDITPAE